MAATTTTSTKSFVQQAHATRERVMGIVFLVLAIAMYWLFANGVDSALVSTFGLNQGQVPAADRLPDWVIPSSGTVTLLAVLSAAMGGYQLARGFGRLTNVILGIVALSFIFTFLVWATRDQSINLAGMLKTAVLRSVPLTLGALSGILCERAGVVNIAIEGLMLGSAMMSTLVGSYILSQCGPADVPSLCTTYQVHLWGGLLAGLLTSGLLAFVHAVLSIRYKVDQIISGTVINIFSTGMTSFISSKFMQQIPELNNVGVFKNWPVPVLSKLPVVGGIFFDSNIFTYGTYILLVVVHVALFYTRWGLRVRAVGEHPKAADTLGINVFRTRYVNVVLGGLMAGFGGAYFTLGSVGRFEELMTAGRGFIGLAAMIFGKWTPFGAFGSSLIFGFADSLQNKLALLRTPIPSQFLLMAPYIATMIALAGLVGRAIPPAADGQPYEKQ
ncbi:MAG: ABC transporter permease [Chloroflexi bacterium]|nr:ABC transporter permease [Chloroflexota bacterium]